MSDKVALDLSTRHQVAERMAHTILITIEDKKWKDLTRVEYLKTVVQCVRALDGLNP